MYDHRVSALMPHYRAMKSFSVRRMYSGWVCFYNW